MIIKIAIDVPDADAERLARHLQDHYPPAIRDRWTKAVIRQILVAEFSAVCVTHLQDIE